MRQFLPLLLCVMALGSARAQGEFDRAREPDADRRYEDTAPVGSLVFSSSPRRVPEFFPEDVLDPSQLPAPEPEPAKATSPSRGAGIEFKLQGKIRATAGHDANVFRAYRGVKEDGFFRGQAEVEVLTKLPIGTEVFAEVSGESMLYFQRVRANEAFVASFLEIFQPLTAWLDAGVQNTYEFSKLNLLDDNGDLFPRGRFGSQDEELRAFLIFRPLLDDVDEGDSGFRPRDLAIELGGGFRDKDYEENRGVDSLDYTELRLDGSISYRFSRRPRSRLKVKYRFRRRDYREFRARSRDGLSDAATHPRLELQRHQLSMTLFQEVRPFGFKARFIVGLGSAYNRDLFQNDRSYREGSVSVRAEWWLLEDVSRLDVSVRGVGRDFIVRRPTLGGGRLHHRLLTLTLGFWQGIGRLPPKRDPEVRRRRDAGADLHANLALFGRALATIWRSKDFQEDYDRYVLEAGLEISW